jgi:predicted ArsR family transcriptional regulator
MRQGAGAEHRTAIVEALRAERHGLDAAALADRLGLHANTVRWHLGLLGDEGLVSSEPVRNGGRGRPTVVFRLTPDGIARDRDEYRLLATMLTAAVADTPDGAARAYATGTAWGRDLGHGVEPGGAVDAVVELLDDQGFAATVDGETIEMRRCPFWALAASHPQVVCTLHHGLIDGALEAAGTDERVGELQPFVEPRLCVARLRRDR